ncbi:hypothetical protein [Alicyclobacillus sp. SO9]|uniref:hypothetical protein n=1 Tax=Alicyclobacillus sp. SO9 TaxID=2665646 RepID=UPI0018E79E1A|nr:hypothetical protein [Alicyclobacillus sp. SO9]QQE77823.1 hypothetical protein GI364_18150 [Alicyclobacillus sp. SO9]
MKSKTLRRWTIWLAVITIAEVGVFHHYNQQLTPNSQVSPVRKYSQSDFHLISNIGTTKLQHHLYALSPDHSNFAYITAKNTFLVTDTQSGKVLVNKPLSYKPDFIKWIDNSQLIVGTENPDQNGLKNIRFNTFDVNSKTFRLIHVFKQYKQNASLENVAFSPYTNDVYVLLGGSNKSLEYHFNTNNTMFPYPLSGRLVRNLMVSQTSDQLYYQDVANGQPNVWVYDFHTSASHLISRDAKLLHINNNTLTYAQLNQSGSATVLKTVSSWKNGSKTLLKLSSPIPFSQLFMYKNQVYRVGSTKMTNLKTKKTITLPDNQSIVNWQGNLYLLQASGKVYYFDPSAQTGAATANQSSGGGTRPAGSSKKSNSGNTGSSSSSGGQGGSSSGNQGGGQSSQGGSGGGSTGTSGSTGSTGSSGTSSGSGNSGGSGSSGGSITGNSIITPSK